QNGQGLIRGGNFAEAVRYLESQVKSSPEDAELRRLLAAAAFDRAVELDDQAQFVTSRLYLVSTIHKTVSDDTTGNFNGAKELLTKALAENAQAYASSRRAIPEADALLAKAAQEAETAVQMGMENKGSLHDAAIQVSVWIDAYRVVRARDLRESSLRLERLGMEPAQLAAAPRMPDTRAKAAF